MPEPLLQDAADAAGSVAYCTSNSSSSSSLLLHMHKELQALAASGEPPLLPQAAAALLLHTMDSPQEQPEQEQAQFEALKQQMANMEARLAAAHTHGMRLELQADVAAAEQAATEETVLLLQQQHEVALRRLQQVLERWHHAGGISNEARSVLDGCDLFSRLSDAINRSCVRKHAAAILCGHAAQHAGRHPLSCPSKVLCISKGLCLRSAVAFSHPWRALSHPGSSCTASCNAHKSSGCQSAPQAPWLRTSASQAMAAVAAPTATLQQAALWLWYVRAAEHRLQGQVLLAAPVHALWISNWHRLTASWMHCGRWASRGLQHAIPAQ